MKNAFLENLKETALFDPSIVKHCEDAFQAIEKAGYTIEGDGLNYISVFPPENTRVDFIFEAPHCGSSLHEEYQDHPDFALKIRPEYIDPTHPYARHELFDPGTPHLMIEIIKALAAQSDVYVPILISAKSRLIDLNRPRIHARTIQSSQYPELAYHFMMDISDDDFETMLKKYYDPYGQAYNKIKAKYPEAYTEAFHSFTPFMNGATRDYRCGLLGPDPEEPVFKKLFEFYKGVFPDAKINAPYDASSKEIQPFRTERELAGSYSELEIRNDVLKYIAKDLAQKRIGDLRDA